MAYSDAAVVVLTAGVAIGRNPLALATLTVVLSVLQVARTGLDNGPPAAEAGQHVDAVR